VTSSKTKYNQSEVARIAGKSRTTITQHMKSGKLAYAIDDNGTKVIDAAELIRVYGDACDFDRADSNAPAKAAPSPGGEQGMYSELDIARKQLSAEQDERDRERNQLQKQIDQLESALERAQNSEHKLTLLLEDRRNGAEDWKDSFKVLESRIANQEKIFQKEREEKDQAKQQIRRLKIDLGKERNKTLLQKLFG